MPDISKFKDQDELLRFTTALLLSAQIPRYVQPNVPDPESELAEGGGQVDREARQEGDDGEAEKEEEEALPDLYTTPLNMV